jgi:hypothetical protein
MSLLRWRNKDKCSMSMKQLKLGVDYWKESYTKILHELWRNKIWLFKKLLNNKRNGHPQNRRKSLLAICQTWGDNQNMQGAQKTKLPQNQWPNKEMGNWTKQLFQRKKSKWQKAHEKMLTIPGHKGSANQNHTKITCHSC